MRRLSTVAIVIAGLALFGFVIFQIGVASQHHHRQHGQPQRSEHTDDSKRVSEDSSAASSGIQIECDPNCAAQESAEHRNESPAARIFRKSVDDPLAGATIVLALATLVLAFYTAVVARATKRAAEHIPRVERAYVFCGPQVEPWDDGVRAVLFFKNYGKTPATIERFLLSFQSEIPDKPPAINVIPFNTGDFILGAGEEFTWPEGWATQNAKRDRFIRGGVVYRDIFHETHVSWFSVFIMDDRHGVRRAVPESWNTWT